MSDTDRNVREERAMEYIERVRKARARQAARRVFWAEFVMICFIILLLFVREVGA